MSTYDDSYEEIIDKEKDRDTGNITSPENNPNSSMNLNKKQSNVKPITADLSNITPIIVESQDPGSDFLSPMFDLSDAPILDFSNSFSSNSSSDPSSLISKVRENSTLYISLFVYNHIVLIFSYFSNAV
jgi:hypothetical protein